MSFQQLQKKIRRASDYEALIVNAPQEYKEMIEGMKYDVNPSEEKNGKYDFVQIFGTKKSDLEHLVQELSSQGKYDCFFWICYPKGSGRIKSDINRKVVWDIASMVGMQCVTQIAIDETWSALRCRPGKMAVV